MTVLCVFGAEDGFLVAVGVSVATGSGDGDGLSGTVDVLEAPGPLLA
jgi:hypothetical protein